MTESIEDSAAGGKKSPSFWDSWTFFAIFLIAIVILRFFVFEPFKIPSGSMEPTLIGHEDYGDRILTNKMAYVPLWQVLAAAGGLAALIVAACVGGRVWKRPKLLAIFGLMLLVVVAGFSTALMRGAMAGEPRRLDIVVFSYDPAWMGKHDTPKNYIKRLVGLPGDTLVVSGGDLFLRDKVTLKDEIIRKWEYDPELQENLWQPVARCAFREKLVPEIKDANDPFEAMAREAVITENAAAFPWKPEGGSAKRLYDEHEKRWVLKVEGECELNYPFRVTNVYCKMGRWPFKHTGCLMNKLERTGEGGVLLRDARAKSEIIRPMLPNSWSGVRCPNCGEVCFPLVRDLAQVPDGQPKIVPDFDWTPINEKSDSKSKTDEQSDSKEEKAPPDYGDVSAARGTPFFYGGHSKEHEVGDLKIEVAVEPLTAGGAMTIEVGSDKHYAAWSLSLGSGVPKLEDTAVRHVCSEAATLSSGQAHVVSLAYVDGTVMASLDGRALEPKKIPGVAPIGAANLQHVARVSFTTGASVRITRLDLYHDLFYTTSLDNSFDQDPVARDRDGNPIRDTKRTWKDGLFIAEIPKFNPMAPESDLNRDMFMVMGDNSPSSQDSRVWGFVPRENFVGRGTLVWWPPSRWRVLH